MRESMEEALAIDVIKEAKDKKPSLQLTEITEKVAKILCPEAWDPIAFRDIVKAANKGKMINFNVVESMNAAKNSTRIKAAEIVKVVCDELSNISRGE